MKNSSALIQNLAIGWEVVKNGKEYEQKGYSPDKTWFQKKGNPAYTALFKPDSHINSSDCEFRAAQAAQILGLRWHKREGCTAFRPRYEFWLV
jgi:hypothetical protein